MKRNGFTMVELIFVIVIIGILAAIALPKFSKVRDHAKINSELTAMSSMDGAITAVKEFRAEDFNDDNISWHQSGLKNEVDDAATQAATYKSINDSQKVLSEIAKKTEDIKIVGLFGSDGNDINASGDTTPYKNSVLILTGRASDAKFGIAADSELSGQDSKGKPDKNDVWVFNPNNWDINVTSTDPLYQNPTVIPGQSIGLVDVNATASTTISGLSAVRSDTTNGSAQVATAVN